MGKTEGVAPSSALSGGHGAYNKPGEADRSRHNSTGIEVRLRGREEEKVKF